MISALGVVYKVDVIFFSLGGYLLTQKDVFFDRSRACQIVASLMDMRGKMFQIDLPPPAIVKVCHASHSVTSIPIFCQFVQQVKHRDHICFAFFSK